MKYMIKRMGRVALQVLASHIISVLQRNSKERTDGINPFCNDLLFEQ